MKVQRICFYGTRTDKAEETAAFFRDVLGLEALRLDPSWSVTRMPSGRFDYVEVFGASMDDPDVFPTGVDVMISFAVEDLTSAHEDMVDAGAELLGDVVWAAEKFRDSRLEGVGWFFFRAPDGRVYCIEQTEPSRES